MTVACRLHLDAYSSVACPCATRFPSLVPVLSEWQVMHLDAYSSRVQTLSLRTMDDTYPDDVVHLDHNAGTKTRIWVMAGAAARLLADLGDAHGRPVRRHLRLLEQRREGLSKKLQNVTITVA